MNTAEGGAEEDRERYMKVALQEAAKAMDEGEVPVGAVIVKDNKIIAKAHNRVEAAKDPTAHAEILVIGAAADYNKDWRLEECTLYVTLEPCPMCAGAILNSRVSTVVFGARDPRLGACGSTCNLLELGLLGRYTKMVSGVMEADCAGLLRFFFSHLRKQSKTSKRDDGQRLQN